MKFEFATATRIIFGPGASGKIASVARGMGNRALVVGGRSTERAEPVLRQLLDRGLTFERFQVLREPTVEMALDGVETARRGSCDFVIGIGGGSVIDTGKAIAALMANPGDIFDYLEVIGRGQPLTRVPASYIAVPTTAGTGAEVTRNAVLASTEHGVKVSLRSPLMLPDVAVVDPLMTHSMSPAVTAGTGLDALTQLIEPFLSAQTNPLTDGICREGMRRAAISLRKAWENGRDATARENMAVASLFGGLALANAKLGGVHGIAGPLGGMISAPHGALCGRLLPIVMAANLGGMKSRDSDNPILKRYEETAAILTRNPGAQALDGIKWLERLGRDLKTPGLKRLGLKKRDIPQAVEKSMQSSSMAGNAVTLTRAEVTAILEKAM